MRLFTGVLIASMFCASAGAETLLAGKQAAAPTSVAIALLIVKESRDDYYETGHPCACPDDVTRNGRSCRKMSA
jgi:hypothetical protein